MLSSCFCVLCFTCRNSIHSFAVRVDSGRVDEKRSAWTCWRSGVKFSHGSTSGRWPSYDRTNSLRTPTMKESPLLREKPLPRSLFQHVQTLCMPSFVAVVLSNFLAVETLPIDRWHDRTTGEDLRARSIAIEVKHETLPANRTRLLAAPVATPSWSTGMRHAVGAAMAIVLKISTVIIWSWPVKCTTTKDRSRKRAVMAEG